MNKVVKVLVGVTMVAGLFVTNVEAKGMRETGRVPRTATPFPRCGRP